jgi:hypothetical protein
MKAKVDVQEWFAFLKVKIIKVRLCVVLSQLYKINVRRENFPLPMIEKSFGPSTGANYFSNCALIVYVLQTKLAQENKLNYIYHTHLEKCV